MAMNHFPFHNRILFRFLLPVVGVGVVCCTLLVTYLSAPMKAFLTRQFDANLQLAATMGLRTCEENFNYLMELRLEKNLEMNQATQNEAMEEIKAISRHFPRIHLMVIKSGRFILASSVEGTPEKWSGPPLDGLNDVAIDFDFVGKAVRAHLQYFPFWDWQVISFVYKQDYQSPVRMAYSITYMSAAVVFLAILITALAVFHLFINRPLNQLVTATDRVAGGQLVKIDRIAPTEFGRLMASFNAMIDSLDSEKKQVSSLIHELKESEARFKALHNASFGGIFIHDQGTVLDCNQGLLDMTGYSEAEMIGMDGFLMIAERFRKEVHEKVAASYEKPYDVYGLRKNGDEFPLRIEARDIPYKGRTVRFVEYRDITVEKQAEEELRRLKNYLSNIIDSMPSVLVGVDGEGKVTQWNRQAEQVTGISVAKARSQPLATVFPRLKGEMDNIKAAIRERNVLRDMKVPHQRQHETRYEDVTIFPLIANGVEGAVIRVDDVTERVRLEEMMIQSEKMLSVGGLAAGMAHEINNPLAGILQSTSVLENRLLSDLPANRKAAEAAGTSMAAIRRYLEIRKLPGMLENISASGRRAAAIVRNMLSFARKSEKVVSSHDLGALLDQTLELVQTDYSMKKHYDFKKITILREYEDRAAPVPCEASKIQQVFMNILKNGAEAMAGANAAPTPPAFILRVQDDGDWMRVEIEDNGPGMEESTRRRIFEPFYTTKPVGQGTGLGLSVSYFIISEDHNGEMSVQAAENGGTRFVIRLPKARQPG